MSLINSLPTTKKIKLPRKRKKLYTKSLGNKLYNSIRKQKQGQYNSFVHNKSRHSEFYFKEHSCFYTDFDGKW